MPLFPRGATFALGGHCNSLVMPHEHDASVSKERNWVQGHPPLHLQKMLCMFNEMCASVKQ